MMDLEQKINSMWITGNYVFMKLKFMKEFFYTCLNEIVQLLAHLKKQQRTMSLEYSRIPFFLAVALQWLW